MCAMMLAVVRLFQIHLYLWLDFLIWKVRLDCQAKDYCLLRGLENMVNVGKTFIVVICY